MRYNQLQGWHRRRRSRLWQRYVHLVDWINENRPCFIFSEM